MVFRLTGDDTQIYLTKDTDGLWICCRFGEATWRIPRKRTWRHGCTLISASKTLVWDSVTAMFSRTVMHGCWRGPCRAILPKGLCPPLCGTCSRKARRIELNGSISPGSREVRTTWSSHFESLLMESILEYSITYPEVKKHCSLRHMQTDSRVKRRLVYWHYPMLNLLKIRTVNQS